MKFSLKLTGIFLFGTFITFAQNVGINQTGATPHSSALLDLDASPTNNMGFAMPSLTTAERRAIASPKDGLQVYDINLKGFYYYNTALAKCDCVSNPAGTVQYFANSTAPSGYLICDGSLQSTTTYPELFNAIGYLYGGSGATFKLPDLRGEFIRGAALSSTVDAGRVFGSWQKGSLLAGDIDGISTINMGSVSTINPNGGIGLVGWDAFNPANYTNTGVSNANVSTSNPSPVSRPELFGTARPRNIALLSCIKY